jgi:hypothetical protein
MCHGGRNGSSSKRIEEGREDSRIRSLIEADLEGAEKENRGEPETLGESSGNEVDFGKGNLTTALGHRCRCVPGMVAWFYPSQEDVREPASHYCMVEASVPALLLYI